MKKFINLNILRAIQLLLSLFIASTLFIGEFDYEIGLILPNAIEYLPVAASVLIIVLFALEFFKSKPWIRLIYLIIAFLVCLMMNESIEYLNQSIWLFGFVYMILVLVSFLRTRPDIANVKSEIPYKKCLPIGFYSKKNLIFTYSYLIAFVAVVIADCVLSKIYSISYWYTLPAICVVCFVLMFYLLIKFNTLGRLLSYVNKELNFKKFDEELSKILNNNLHPETSNYLMILRTNYLFAYDKTEGIKQFEQIQRPNAKQYTPAYDLMEIVYLINKDDIEGANEAVNKYTSTHKNSKTKEILDLMLKVYTTEEEIVNIESFLPINGNQPFNNLSNIYELMIYYKTRGQIEKAADFADMILDKNTDFEEWNREARNVKVLGEAATE